MFELLVPAEKAHIQRLGGDKKAYDLELRPRLMVGAIRELQDGGVEPDVWKIEGLDRREDCEHIVAAARRDGRDPASAAIILGPGRGREEGARVVDDRRRVPGFIGFAVGRTDFWEPLCGWRSNRRPRAGRRRDRPPVPRFVDISRKPCRLTGGNECGSRPSILAADFRALGEQVTDAERAGADRIRRGMSWTGTSYRTCRWGQPSCSRCGR